MNNIKYLTQMIRTTFYFPIIFLMLVITSCNKDVEQFTEDAIAPSSAARLDQLLHDNPDDSLYYRMILTAGLTSYLTNPAQHYTLFVTNNAGVKPTIAKLSGGAIAVGATDAEFSTFISHSNSSLIAQYKTLIEYNTIPQDVLSTNISGAFTSFAYPTVLNPFPISSTLIGQIFRYATYPTTRNGKWLNNVPITDWDKIASNGVIHHTDTIVEPAKSYIWGKIDTAQDLKYFKAAILKADEGVDPDSTLQHYLSTFGPDFTVFAPVDTAFKSFIKEVLVVNNLPPMLADGYISLYGTTFLSNPSSIPLIGSTLASVITPEIVRGILVYHILNNRAFTNSFPTTSTSCHTLLNSAPGYENHRGLKLKCTFGPVNGVNFQMVVTASLTDVLNRTSNLIINAKPFTPSPLGTSDQNFKNGILNKVTKVMLPQSF